jgi:hypothetical protein
VRAYAPKATRQLTARLLKKSLRVGPTSSAVMANAADIKRPTKDVNRQRRSFVYGTMRFAPDYARRIGIATGSRASLVQ